MEMERSQYQVLKKGKFYTRNASSENLKEIRNADFENGNENNENETIEIAQYTMSDRYIENEFNKSKSIKYRILTFLRNNYLCTIKVLSLTICLLLFIIVISTIMFGIVLPSEGRRILRNDNNGLNYSIDYELINKINKMGKSVSYLNAQSIPCSKIHCKNFDNPCNLTDFTYRSIKQYSCCKCFKNEMSLIRYESSMFLGTSIIVTGGGQTCQTSEYDLLALPELECLSGSWDLIKESEDVCYLKFSILKNSCVYEN